MSMVVIRIIRIIRFNCIVPLGFVHQVLHLFTLLQIMYVIISYRLILIFSLNGVLRCYNGRMGVGRTLLQ